MNADLIAELDRAIRFGSPTTPAFLKKLRTALEEADKDAARLDLLEREANEDPITLHNMPFGKPHRGLRGLGLACTERSIRKALDDLAIVSKKPEAGS